MFYRTAYQISNGSRYTTQLKIGQYFWIYRMSKSGVHKTSRPASVFLTGRGLATRPPREDTGYGYRGCISGATESYFCNKYYSEYG